MSVTGHTSPSSGFTGAMKVEFIRRVGADWQDLADILEVRTDERARFGGQDNPARAIWEWLDARGELDKLPGAVTAIGRQDLAVLLGAPGGGPVADVIDSSALIAERTEEFVGRRRLSVGLWNTLEDPSFRSGYVIVTGEPGIGKTSLLASLVKEHGLVHHFNSALGGVTSPGRFLRNVCAQLVVTHGLPYRALPDDVEDDSATLLRLLGEVSAKQRVVVAVDALDEAVDRRTVGNRLHLPNALPPDAYVLVTMRNRTTVPLYVDASREVRIDERDPENERDIREFIAAFVDRHRPVMMQRLDELGRDEAGFASLVAERSEGNFMYVRQVLRGVRDRTLGGEGLDSLPQGLADYYGHLERQLGVVDGAGPERQLRILAVLAVWPEPLDTAQLAAFSGQTFATAGAVLRRWAGFLNETEGSGVPRYALYHASFRDFLAARLDLGEVRDEIARGIEDQLP